ncbi:hypothetical protein AB0B63_18490 [Micromonospora sp. NPDC049081]
MNITDYLALQRLTRRFDIRPWTDQPDLPAVIPNRADRRRADRARGARR